MSTATEDDLRLLFLDARTYHAWLDRPVDDALLERLYGLARFPPTSGNTNPMRLVFVKSAAAKELLKPALSPGNVDKTMSAPVTAIVAYDVAFYDLIPRLFPQGAAMRDRLAGLPEAARERFAVLNSSLQGAYLILAARALGLDCGPMGGFDSAKVDAAFFADGKWKSSFLVNLGYGDPAKLHPRLPRLEFEEACKIV